MERYSSEHPETVEELGNGYWKKFETMYGAFLKRKAVEELRELKNAMISGLWGNPNFDDKDYRRKALLDIEDGFQNAINDIYNGIKTPEEERAELMSDPFFAAMDLS